MLTVPEYLSAARLHIRGLQRRQVPARPAVLRSHPRPQRPPPGGMGVERSPPRPRPHDEDRQGGDDRAARRGRDVGAARPQERGRDVDAVDADHRRPRRQNRRRHAPRSASREGLSNHSPGLSINWDPAEARHHGRGSLATFSGPPSLALPWAAEEVAAAGRAALPTRPGSRSPRT